MRKILIFVVVALLTVLSGCSFNKALDAEKEEINIAYQYGLSYAPFEIMKQKKLIEEKLPNIKINWFVMSSGSAMNEGILSGDIDIAVMGTAPFLMGVDKGIPYKIYSSISAQPLVLITNNKNIKSIIDFKEGDKIAVPAMGSIQHIALAMMAKAELGDASALDEHLISMSSPDALQTMQTNQEVKAHVASSPYYNLSLEQKGHNAIAYSTDYIREDTSIIVAVATERLKKEQPKLFNAVEKATDESISYVNEHKEEVAKLLAEQEGLTGDQMLRYLSDGKFSYQTEVVGVLELSEFMKDNHFLENEISSKKNIVFE